MKRKGGTHDRILVERKINEGKKKKQNGTKRTNTKMKETVRKERKEVKMGKEIKIKVASKKARRMVR